VDPSGQSRNLEGPPHGFHPSELPGGPGGPHYPPRGGQGENTDQYYAEQYDQYYRYGWDDQFYEYDDTGQYEYEGWFQDEYGEWQQDPVYKEYYESLEKGKTDPNNSASKNDDQKTDNSSGASEFRNLKESVASSNKEVKDLNKKNIENKPSDNYTIPYGEGYRKEGWSQNEVGDWIQDTEHLAQSSDRENNSKAANKPVSQSTEILKSRDSEKSSTDPVCNGGLSASKNNAPDRKTMPAHITSRPKPPDYEEAWYEEPSDGQYYNSYDWYEDENGEWAYDYRMEEYGYVQNELGEWVPGDGVQDMAGQPKLQRVPSQPNTQQTGPANKQPEEPSSKGSTGLSTTAGKVQDVASEKAAVLGTKANGFIPQEGQNDKQNNINGTKKLDREASKDGFSGLFSGDKPEGSEPEVQKSSLPPRPPDYDDYYYQAEDGNWYNEYDDLGYQFADDELLLIEENDKAALQTVTHVATKAKSSNNSDKVPNSKSDLQTKKPPRPIDFDHFWYQDETGGWRNEYHDMGYEFEEDDSFYTEEELEKEEAKMLKEDKRVKDSESSRSKNESEKAVELKESVIVVSNISDKVVSEVKKEVFKNSTDTPSIAGSTASLQKTSTGDKTKKQPRPADYDDMWYQDYDGNWFNEYDHDGIEYDDVPPDTVTISDKETPLKKNKKNVSFEKSDGPKEKPVSKSGKSPRERWQWAFTRIVQVGIVFLILKRRIPFARHLL